MTEKGYNNGLVSRIQNKISGKKYLISTAQEIGKDYWSTVVFPKSFFWFLSFLNKKVFTIIRNNKDDAHSVHWFVKDMTSNFSENEWLERMPDPEPSEGWSYDAKQKFKEHGIE